MKHHTLKISSLLLIVFAFSSCSSTKVVSDKDNSVDFNEIKSYSFIGWTDESDQVLTRFDKERIEKAFATEAVKRGLTLDDKNPDVLAALFVLGEVKTQKSATTTTTGMHTGMGGMGTRGMRNPGWGWGGGMTMSQSHTTINETNYIEGTIMIELFDPDEKMLIWQAIGTKRVSEDPKKREKGIPKKIADIMKTYPVKPMTK